MKKQISLDIVNQLNKGEKEATNLMEFLAVDLTLLLANTIPEFNFPKLPKPLGITKKFNNLINFNMIVYIQIITYNS